jgi:hypothetical protein
VVDVLNRFYVPVYLSNEDYHGDSAIVTKDERLAWQKIYHDALKEKRSAGSVCVYLVDGDSKGLASMIVSTAASKDNLLKLLETTAEKLKVEGGKPIVPPVRQNPAPRVTDSDLLLYLVARSDQRGSWGEFPSENWIVLKEKEWQAWLPDSLKPGARHSVPGAEVAKLLTYFFPQTEICNFGKAFDPDGPYKHHIDNIVLKSKVLSREADIVRIRLDGQLKLKHTFYPNRDDTNYAESTMLGYLELNARSNRVVRFGLATSSGRYGNRGFSVAVRKE